MNVQFACHSFSEMSQSTILCLYTFWICNKKTVNSQSPLHCGNCRDAIKLCHMPPSNIVTVLTLDAATCAVHFTVLPLKCTAVCTLDDAHAVYCCCFFLNFQPNCRHTKEGNLIFRLLFQRILNKIDYSLFRLYENWISDCDIKRTSNMTSQLLQILEKLTQYHILFSHPALCIPFSQVFSHSKNLVGQVIGKLLHLKWKNSA